MLQRGRKSVSNLVSLNPNAAQPRLTAPAILSKAEAALFNETAVANPHLRRADTALLAAYAQALTKAYKLARQSDAAAVASWEKTMRVTLSIATKLRVTTQAQVRPEYAGRQRQHMQPPSYYDTSESNDD